MSPIRPTLISESERAARQRRISQIARQLGFVGHVEYRHVRSQAGGAQYGLAASPDQDVLIVYAEAFEHDADPEDFSLEAMLAHECGHQKLARDPRLARVLAKFPYEPFEEILASLIGSLLVAESESAQTLVWKGTAELGEVRLSAEIVVGFVERLRVILRHFL